MLCVELLLATQCLHFDFAILLLRETCHDQYIFAQWFDTLFRRTENENNLIWFTLENVLQQFIVCLFDQTYFFVIFNNDN